MTTYPLWDRNELGGGTRLGGKRVGPVAADVPLWDGRPPRLESALGPNGFYVSATPPPDNLGATVLIDVQASNSWGGLARRRFNIGGGQAAHLRLGNFDQVKARVVADSSLAIIGIPARMEVNFSWTWNVVGESAPLQLFQVVTPAQIGQPLPVPEGAVLVVPQVAATITWLAPQFATTFPEAVAAGQEVRAKMGAFSINAATNLVWQLRGL